MLRDRQLPSVANDNGATLENAPPPYTLVNHPPQPPMDAPYITYSADYRAHYTQIARPFQRFTIGAQIERENPGQEQILKIALQNPLGNIYTMRPTGRTLVISAMAPNPHQRWSEGPVGIAKTEPPQIFQAGIQSALDLPNAIFRRR